MLLVGKDGSVFKLWVSGYQFRGIQKREWDSPCDSNWLNIGVRVDAPLGSWQFTRACLLTWELESLATWFDAINREAPIESHIGFTEPVLQFQLLDRSESGAAIRI